MGIWRARFDDFRHIAIVQQTKIVTLLRIFLGLVATSIVSTAISAQDMRPSYPQQYTLSPKGVNLQTGRLIHQQTDLNIGPLKLTRMWETGGSSLQSGFGLGPGQFGNWQFQGWTHNYTAGIYVDNSTNTPFYRVTADGNQYTFKDPGSGIVPGDATTQGMLLTHAGSAWVMTDHSGNQYTFSGSPILLQNVVYANGSIATITYTGNQPKLISSSVGYAIVFDYNTNQTISAACGYNTTTMYVDSSTTCGSSPVVKATYRYDTSPRLTSVNDARLGTTTIRYATTGNDTNISCITFVGSQSCAIQYSYGESVMSFADQVTTQTTAAGNIWRYRYFPPDNPQDEFQQPCWPKTSRSEMTDAAGRGYAATYDRGYLILLQAPEGNTQYLYPNGCATYGSSGTAPVSVETRLPRPAYVIKPGGAPEYYEYDSRGNAITRALLPVGTDPGGLLYTDPDLSQCCVTLNTPTFPSGTLFYRAVYLPSSGAGSSTVGCGAGPADAKRCDKPTAIIDPNGNEADYTYDPAHGGILTETGPAVNGIRPQTRYTYVQRQAWLKTSAGGYAQTGQPVWLLASKSICKAGAAASSGTGCALGSTDEVITTYDYGPDSGPTNLLLRGIVEDAGGLNLRTCYGYDAQANKISETKPRGTIGACL
jgi:hypothetical protein